MARPPSSRALLALTLAAACACAWACSTAGKDPTARLSSGERERLDAFRSDLEETRALLGMGRV